MGRIRGGACERAALGQGPIRSRLPASRRRRRRQWPARSRRMQFRLFSCALIILNCMDYTHCQGGRWRRSKRGQSRRSATAPSPPARPAGLPALNALLL